MTKDTRIDCSKQRVALTALSAFGWTKYREEPLIGKKGEEETDSPCPLDASAVPFPSEVGFPTLTSPSVARCGAPFELFVERGRFLFVCLSSRPLAPFGREVFSPRLVVSELENCATMSTVQFVLVLRGGDSTLTGKGSDRSGEMSQISRRVKRWRRSLSTK